MHKIYLLFVSYLFLALADWLREFELDDVFSTLIDQEMFLEECASITPEVMVKKERNQKKKKKQRESERSERITKYKSHHFF